MLKFLVPEVIKIKELKNGLKVAELFHGPTLAFKDLALGVVGGLYNYFLERSKKKCIVIVGKQHEAGLQLNTYLTMRQIHIFFNFSKAIRQFV